MASQPKRWTVTSEKFLNQDQIEALTRFLQDRRDLAIARQNDSQAIKDFYIVRTLLESGLRVGEFCALQNTDVQGHRITVRRGKGGKPRTVLLTKGTALMLKEWSNVKGRLGFSPDSTAPLFPSRYRRHYTTRGIQKRVKIIFKSVGFPPRLSVHSLRHTYASLLLATGRVSVATVKENLGHHSIAVTNLYSHAIGDLTDVELYEPSSQNSDFSEPQESNNKKKASDSVKQFLRKANFK